MEKHWRKRIFVKVNGVHVQQVYHDVYLNFEVFNTTWTNNSLDVTKIVFSNNNNMNFQRKGLFAISREANNSFR